MAEDSWIVNSARREDGFTDEPDALRRTVLRRNGPEYQQMSRVPLDLSVN